MDMHIDGNPCNITRCNLRIVTHQQDLRYRHDKTSYAGVSENNGQFRALATIEGKSRCIGTFASVKEAAMVRDEVYEVIGKGFNRLNFAKRERCLHDGHMRQVAAFFNKHNIKV